jgi:hypothetical protein
MVERGISDRSRRSGWENFELRRTAAPKMVPFPSQEGTDSDTIRLIMGEETQGHDLLNPCTALPTIAALNP